MKNTPFLMFQHGACRAAIDFYTAVVPACTLESLVEFPASANPAGASRLVMMAELTIAGQAVRMNDSPIAHDFDFTPSQSFFLECDSPEQLDQLAAALGENGSVLMPIDEYDFAARFTWLNDQFGVSWQLVYGLATAG